MTEITQTQHEAHVSEFDLLGQIALAHQLAVTSEPPRDSRSLIIDVINKAWSNGFIKDSDIRIGYGSCGEPRLTLRTTHERILITADGETGYTVLGKKAA